VLVSRDDVIYKRIDPEYSDGCVWARYINMLNITNEYDFIYQVDSHMLHDMNWDRALIEDYKRAMDMCETNKVIITGSCKSFIIEEKDGEIKTYLCQEENDACQVKYYTIDPDTLIPDVHAEDAKAARRRKILSEIGRWQWKKYLEACREDLLSEFHKEFGVDFINLDIEDRARTYSLDVVPGKIDLLAISKKPKKKVKLPKTLFMSEDEE
jgi:hypothetical protein